MSESEFLRNGVEYLTLEDILGLVDRLRVGPVRDAGLLDSAVQRPRASAFGNDAYPDMPTKAAALMDSIVRNHALVDGNKRLAVAATAVFLQLNNLAPRITQTQMLDLVLDVAGDGGRHPELAEIAERLTIGPVDVSDMMARMRERLNRPPLIMYELDGGYAALAASEDDEDRAYHRALRRRRRGGEDTPR